LAKLDDLGEIEMQLDINPFANQRSFTKILNRWSDDVK
jgi:hypothetical protein